MTPLEKLVYVLWAREGLGPAQFGGEMRSGVCDRLLALDTPRVSVNLVDDDVAYAASVRRTRLDPPPAGTLSVWLDEADARGPVEAAFSPVIARSAGYLVVESVPIPNATRTVPTGERVPGTNMVALLERPDWIAWDAWIAHWHGHHRKVACETQDTFQYIRNVVVRPLTPDAPPWWGIVEEGFEREAVIDPMLWYDARGDEERLRKNVKRMVESCQAFLDLERVESHPMSEYRLRE